METALPKRPQRQANLELLRMLSMYMVIVMHLFATGTEQLAQANFGGISYFAVWFVNTLCHAANICFVLIGAYFLVMQPFRLSRLLRLWLTVLFYTVTGLLLSTILRRSLPGREDLLYAFFPLTRNDYWFMTQYFLLLAVSPLLNRLIHTLTQKEHQSAILLLMVLFSVIPTFFFWGENYFSNGFDLPWFVTVYFIGAYLRLYGLSLRRPGLKFFAVAFLLTVSRVLLGAIALRLTGSFHGAGLLYHGGLLFTVMAVCLFCAFQKLVIRGEVLERATNAAASCAIGAYLLHMNRFFPELSELVRLYDCDNLFWKMIPRVLLVALFLFALGLAAEALRKQLARLCGEKKLCTWVDEKTKDLLQFDGCNQ